MLSGPEHQDPAAPALAPAATPDRRRDPVGWLPYVTPDLPGIGGKLKQHLEDFAVEEIPLYDPVDEGEHVYLFVEKRNLSTSQLVHAIAKHFDVPKRAVGFAGMKDKNAVTRQVLSVHTPGKTYRDFPDLINDQVVVLSARMHTNKLRLGHLRGNRFSIKVRGVDLTSVVRARRVLGELERRGVANYFGEQRFGVRLNNHLLGLAALKSDWTAALDHLLGPDPVFPDRNAAAREHYRLGEIGNALDAFPPACRHERIALRTLEQGGNAKRAVLMVDIEQRRFWFSALQSAIFNRVLAARVEAGTWDRLLEGDVAAKRENNALFAVTPDVAASPETAQRLASKEISPSGPLWGSRMMRASGAVDAAELAELAAFGVKVEDLAAAVTFLGDSMVGARRPLRIALDAVEVEGGIDQHGHYVRLDFTLPPGAFATVVLREVMKVPVATGDDREGE